jgi:DNA-binding transcriptional regulator YhcF (GntR family)
VVASLAINPNTVAKAYRELEIKGLGVGRPDQGRFIQATLTPVALPELTGVTAKSNRRSYSLAKPGAKQLIKLAASE